MFQDKVRLKETINIVGDPCAKESEWLPVCIAAGEKQLVRPTTEPAKRSPLRIFVGNFVCSTSIVSASIGHFLLVIFTASVLFCSLTGFGTNWFMEQFKLQQYLALPALVFGGIGFWQQFACRGSKPLYFGTAAILLGLLGLCSFTPGPLVILLALAVAGHSLMSFIGLETRRALPDTFNVRAALWAQGISCALLAGFVLTATCFAVQNSSTYQPHPYSNMSTVQVCIMQAMLGLGVGLPCAVIAFKSKSRSFFSCAWLSVLMQAPLLFALTFVLILSGAATIAAGIDPSFVMRIFDYFNMPAFSTDMIYTGGAVSLSLLVAMTSIVIWSLVGSKIGVVANHRFSQD